MMVESSVCGSINSPDGIPTQKKITTILKREKKKLSAKSGQTQKNTQNVISQYPSPKKCASLLLDLFMVFDFLLFSFIFSPTNRCNRYPEWQHPSVMCDLPHRILWFADDTAYCEMSPHPIAIGTSNEMTFWTTHRSHTFGLLHSVWFRSKWTLQLPHLPMFLMLILGDFWFIKFWVSHSIQFEKKNKQILIWKLILFDFVCFKILLCLTLNYWILTQKAKEKRKKNVKKNAILFQLST